MHWQMIVHENNERKLRNLKFYFRKVKYTLAICTDIVST